MRFTVDAVPGEQFARWIEATRGSGPALDTSSYGELAKPSEAVAPFTYRSVAPGLFDRVVSLVMHPAAGPTFACVAPAEAE